MLKNRKDDGAQMAGPQHYDESVRSIKDPPLPSSISGGSAQFLIQKRRFPDAVPAVSLLSIAGLDDVELAYTSRIILLACMRSPGAMVFGARVFISGDSEDEAVEFLMAAGYSREDAEKIAPPGWSSQFSTNYIQRHETSEELSNNPAPSEINGSGPRDHEAAVQGCGAFC